MDALLIKHRLDYKIQEFRTHISLGRIKKGSLIKLKNIEQAIGVKGINLRNERYMLWEKLLLQQAEMALWVKVL